MNTKMKQGLVALTVLASALSLGACDKSSDDAPKKSDKSTSSEKSTDKKDAKKSEEKKTEQKASDSKKPDQKDSKDQAKQNEAEKPSSGNSDSGSLTAGGSSNPSYMPTRDSNVAPYPAWMENFDPQKCITKPRPNNQAGAQDFLNCYGKVYSAALMGLDTDILHAMYVPADYKPVKLNQNGKIREVTNSEFWSADLNDVLTGGQNIPGLALPATKFQILEYHKNQDDPERSVARVKLSRGAGIAKNASGTQEVKPLQTPPRFAFLAHDGNRFFLQGFIQ
ncbi:hypothetical protein BSR28_00805 [Boudabousia liubingyangii]|uniref:hypothetical protein n=1 Tax=Boudabousia liubingyangii TaxID=1921764 RepID=UPI00093A81B3|nr:hypothetical protein [Boudabousia liubingyangii]OKL48281.1 hypothetical protein BSR28_00805 [Boudabousia liubingyangii]